MGAGPTRPLEDLHRDWCAALESAAGAGLVAAADFPAGYEHAYETTDPKDRRLVIVCPWHWRQYSHYQFWELAAVPFLAREAGYRDVLLVTNDAWTDWCLVGLRHLYGTVAVGDRDAAIGDALTRLRLAPMAASLPEVPPPGSVLIGAAVSGASTVDVKRRLAEDDALDLVRPAPMTSALPGVVLRPPFASRDGRTLVVVKGFRNPDPVHEAKMLAGRGFLCPPDRRLIVVVDGKPRDTPSLIARSGAIVCTPDRAAEALRTT